MVKIMAETNQIMFMGKAAYPATGEAVLRSKNEADPESWLKSHCC